MNTAVDEATIDADWVADELEKHLGGPARSEVVDLVWFVGQGHYTVQHAARQFGCTTRALCRRMERAGYPTPGLIIAFARTFGIFMAYGRGGPLHMAVAQYRWDPGNFNDRADQLFAERPTVWRMRGGRPEELVAAFVARWRAGLFT